jgi:hypothetical protein
LRPPLRFGDPDLLALGRLATGQALVERAESILSFCKRGKVDLVVMTRRWHGGLKRAILGSVADQSVRSPLV